MVKNAKLHIKEGIEDRSIKIFYKFQKIVMFLSVTTQNLLGTKRKAI